MFSGYMREEVGGWMDLQLVVTRQAAVVLDSVISPRYTSFGVFLTVCSFLFSSLV